MRRWRVPVIVFAIIAIVGAIWSYVILTTPPQQTLDVRVHEVASQLRCPVCQSESVADSPSTIAQQMRGVIRQQLAQGKSEAQVIQYFQARYGSSIVWSPPWQGFSLLAWLVPIGLMLGGFVLLFFVLRDWRSAAPTTDSLEIGPVALDEKELARFRAQLERELTEEDPLFMRPTSRQREAI